MTNLRRGKLWQVLTIDQTYPHNHEKATHATALGILLLWCHPQRVGSLISSEMPFYEKSKKSS